VASVRAREMTGQTIHPPSGALHQMRADTAANSRLTSYQAGVEFEDLPATTSAVTYEVRLASSAVGTPVHLNIRDSELSLRGESNLSVMEIAA
jgi:hypothetical protein